MFGAQLNSPAISVTGALTDQSICCSPFSSSHYYSSNKQDSVRFLDSWKRRCVGKSRAPLKSVGLISCKSSFGRFSRESDHSGEGSNREVDDDDDYVEATILMSETISHYHMLMHGSQEETKWQSSLQLGPFSFQPKDPRSQVNSIGAGFPRRFQFPAIFLKISCDGDFVLPIIVEGHAIKKLIDSFHEDERGDCNQFQFLRNLVEQLGYVVKKVKITERVRDTYFARVLFHKRGEKSILYVDARPSDAINIAKRFKAPIYVNKQIVLTDATRIPYGMNQKKPIYDVTLDSAADGPDLLSEELNAMRNMNLAAQEERYSDAAMWRDKLKKLLESN